MNSLPPHKGSYKLAALSIIAISLLSLLPQFRFWLIRGSRWQGSYVTLQPDEIVYSAYVNAIIDGRPRRTDPATGRDDSPQSPVPESLFSIQFIPPFVVGGIARTLGTTASGAFIAMLGISGVLTSLSLFWLFSCLTRDRKFSAVAILIVLCFGALAGGHGIIGVFLTSHSKLLGLPFLRRYEPAVPLPLFFVFCTLTWQAFVSLSKRAAIINALVAGLILGVLIFSYFYLWTAAAAWVVSVACLWLLLRPSDKGITIRLLLLIVIPATFALVLYGFLLSNLPPTTDKAQILTYTHRTDLLRIPEIIGALTLFIFIVSIRRRNKILISSPSVIFSISFALLPFLVFNQQLITGRSIQPFHYEVLIANYVALMGLVLLYKSLRPEIRSRTLLLIASLCLVWAVIEVDIPFQVQQKLFVEIDQMVPVLLKLKDNAKSDGTWEGLRTTGKTPGLVFSPQYGISQLLPVWAPQGSLLAPGSESFQSLPEEERKERLFEHFYYCGKTQEYVRELLKGGFDPFLSMRAKSIIFGVDRVTPVLGWDFQVIKPDEIEREVREYEVFANSFSRGQSQKRPLMYAVTRTSDQFDFSRIDRWYERDGGLTVGDYILYRLKLRS
jgi:hypothetical protein